MNSGVEEPVPQTPVHEETIEDGQNLQLVGQELVPVSQNAVVQESTVEDTGEGAAEREMGSPSGIHRTSEESKDKESQGQVKTPLGRKKPKAIEDKPRSEGSRKSGGQPLEKTPSGPPTTFRPPESLPLFTPEQVKEAESLQRRSPLLDPSRGGSMEWYEGRRSHEDQDRSWMDIARHYPSFQEAEMRAREVQMRMEMERMLGEFALQLRASQSENSRLREELHQALGLRESSRYATPEEKSFANAGKRGGMPEKEDGSEDQQAEEKEEESSEDQEDEDCRHEESSEAPSSEEQETPKSVKERVVDWEKEHVVKKDRKNSRKSCHKEDGPESRQAGEGRRLRMKGEDEKEGR